VNWNTSLISQCQQPRWQVRFGSGGLQLNRLHDHGFALSDAKAIKAIREFIQIEELTKTGSFSGQDATVEFFVCRG